jgi:hypothetical protein
MMKGGKFEIARSSTDNVARWTDPELLLQEASDFYI